MTGEDLAHLFKYYLQFKNDKIVQKIEYRAIGYKGLYLKHKKLFDYSADVFNKHKLSGEDYVKFFILVYGKTDFHLKDLFMNIMTWNAYIGHV